jgi:hypothetical protein
MNGKRYSIHAAVRAVATAHFEVVADSRGEAIRKANDRLIAEGVVVVSFWTDCGKSTKIEAANEINEIVDPTADGML